MFAKIQYTASTVTPASIAADIVAVLTGTTDVNSLSSIVDKSTSFVNTAVSAAEWTLHDTITNGYVIKSAVSDAPTKFKYVLIDYSASPYLNMTLFESWNNATHVGTNPACDIGYERKGCTTVYGSSSTIFISASAKHIVMASNLAGGTISGPTVIAERTRASLWDTVENNFLPATQIYLPFYFDGRSILGSAASAGYYGFASSSRNALLYRGAYECSSPDKAGAVEMGVRIGKASLAPYTAYATLSASSTRADSITTNFYAMNAFARGYNASLTQSTLAMPLESFSLQFNSSGGNISKRSDIWVLNQTSCASEDEIDFNGNRYVILDIASGTSLNSRLSNLKLIVRKG